MAQQLQQQASERGGQEGVRARLAVVVVCGGDGNEDAAATSKSIRCNCGSVSSATWRAVSMSAAWIARM
ncbi:hypothetical protein [Streptomyces sp. bgisy126]|uniref:hypothetical protein n=1 Tax=unclassified Streptomyces TaxID=2593676 RepID=UPI003EB97B93